jgi:hypothetical protein
MLFHKSDTKDSSKKNNGHNGFVWSQRVEVFDGPGGFGRRTPVVFDGPGGFGRRTPVFDGPGGFGR